MRELIERLGTIVEGRDPDIGQWFVHPHPDVNTAIYGIERAKNGGQGSVSPMDLRSYRRATEKEVGPRRVAKVKKALERFDLSYPIDQDSAEKQAAAKKSAASSAAASSGVAVTDANEAKALGIINRIKAFARGEYFANAKLGPYHVDSPIIKSLIKRKFLKANRAGSIQITPAGKAAAPARHDDNPTGFTGTVATKPDTTATATPATAAPDLTILNRTYDLIQRSLDASRAKAVEVAGKYSPSRVAGEGNKIQRALDKLPEMFQ